MRPEMGAIPSPDEPRVKTAIGRFILRSACGLRGTDAWQQRPLSNYLVCAA